MTETEETTLEERLAQRLKRERHKRDWTIHQMAARLREAGADKASASGVYKSESGTPPRKVPLAELVAYAGVFETTIQDLVTDPMDPASRFRPWYQKYRQLQQSTMDAIDAMEMHFDQGARDFGDKQMQTDGLDLMRKTHAALKHYEEIVDRVMRESEFGPEYREIMQRKGTK